MVEVIEQGTDARVRALISDVLGVEPVKVVPEAYLIADLGADSLDVVDLVMRLEEEFFLSISDDDAAKVWRVGDAVSLVTRLREGAPA